MKLKEQLEIQMGSYILQKIEEVEGIDEEQEDDDEEIGEYGR
jgi:hypothetical protein